MMMMLLHFFVSLKCCWMSLSSTVSADSLHLLFSSRGGAHTAVVLWLLL